MEINCKIIEDIIKLYSKDELNKETEDLLNQHIQFCNSCKTKYDLA